MVGHGDGSECIGNLIHMDTFLDEFIKIRSVGRIFYIIPSKTVHRYQQRLKYKTKFVIRLGYSAAKFTENNK